MWQLGPAEDGKGRERRKRRTGKSASVRPSARPSRSGSSACTFCFKWSGRNRFPPLARRPPAHSTNAIAMQRCRLVVLRLSHSSCPVSDLGHYIWTRIVQHYLRAGVARCKIEAVFLARLSFVSKSARKSVRLMRKYVPLQRTCRPPVAQAC